MERNEKGQFKKSKHNDLVGKRFGKLTVIKDSLKRQHRKVIWECKCDCGNTVYVVSSSLKSLNTKSCGCGQRDYYCNGKHNNPTFIEGTEIGMLDSKVKFSHNTSGHRGVSYNNKNQKYRAYIQFKGKLYSLGSHDTLEEAIKIRENAEDVLYKTFLESIERK